MSLHWKLPTALLFALFVAVSHPAPAAENTAPVERAAAAAKPDPPEAVTREQARKAVTSLTEKSNSVGKTIDATAARSGQDWLQRPVIFGISAARLLASSLLLLVIAVFTVAVVRRIRVFAGRIEDEKEQTWPRMLLSAVRKPLALTIWICGLFFSSGILLDAVKTNGGHPDFSRFFGGLTYAGLTLASFWLIFRVIRGTERKLHAWAQRTDGVLDKVLVPVMGTALRLLVPLLTLFILLGSIDLPDPYEWLSGKLLATILIGSIAYLIIRTTSVAENALLNANRLDVADNLRAREIYTQVSVIRKIIVTCTIFLGAACMLMLFQPVRQLGTSILASAGIAGVVLGFAAQKTLSNLFAGIQIAISQPIRIDDVVIVEGEWGRIENITLTFVTVCIWDLRRLVLPINYFIEKPFQNWTRTSADLLNSIFIYTDYTLPVEPLRKELKRLLDENPLWDKKAWVLQVTDSTPQAMEIRCLMSSSDAPKGWDLKCEIREGLVHFIQKNFPECLPRVRADLHRDGHSPPSTIMPAVKTEDPSASSAPGLDAGSS
jgi:small-conductance mechanosensitive channel